MDFEKLKVAVQKQLDKMCKGPLFRTAVEKDVLWEAYLGAFPEGTNPIHKKRTEHDCQCCKQFIRACGNVVSIKNNKLVSVWDIDVDDLAYQQVVDIMAVLAKSKKISIPFLRTDANLGTDKNHGQNENGEVITYSHFYYRLPSQFVVRADDIGTRISEAVSSHDVFYRGLSELNIEAFDTVLELIDQNSIYRGEEHKAAVEKFAEHKRKFDKLKTNKAKRYYSWLWSAQLGGLARFRNTAIGTLIIDLSEGKELDAAVGAFEAMVAPTNYKRPKALITKAMIKKAQDKVESLGLTSALPRRHAVIEDITINNVLYADRSAKQAMDVFAELAQEAPVNPKKYSKVDEVSIDDFMNKIVPKSSLIELQLEGRHEPNLMSLIAPVNTDVERLFKWKNNFSWAYKGDIADSLMRERVKSAGGNVDGVLRFSIQWNDGDNNQNDFDAHCKEPDGNHIWFSNKGHTHPSSGMLDVDIINPGNKAAVENITWTDLNRMQEGTYTLYVHNYSHNGGRTGFTAEIEYNGEIHSYVYEKELKQDEKVTVAHVKFSKSSGVKFTKELPSTLATKDMWGVHTNNFHKVRVIMNSPNHWDGEETGNRHWFFILENCKNPVQARGFFNEFLKNELTPHRKVFEVLGSKMRVEVTDAQLSGLGFSSTKRNSVLCRVTGKSTRVVKVNF